MTLVGDVSEVSAEQPWPGLLPFTEAAQAFFHGRDEESNELLRSIKRGTLTVLFGQSGLGKSSLLRAGLFPPLRVLDYLPVYIRLQLRAGAPPLVEQLQAAILAECTEHRVESPAVQPGRSLWEHFHRRDADFWSSRNRLLTPVLVFDQFEEIFTLGHGSDATDRRCGQFIDELADLVEHRIPAALAAAGGGEAALPAELDVARDNFRVLLSFREDYLAEFEGLRTRMPSIMRNRVRLARMSGAQAKAAILLSGGHLVAEPVAEQVIAFVSAQRGGARRADGGIDLTEVEPALLSVVCRELNNRRLALGQAGIDAELLQGSAQQQIIADFYESSFAEVDPRLREFVEDQLLTDGGFRDSFAYDDALRQPGVQREQIDQLIERRLIRLEERAGVLRLELTHDLLTEVARDSRDRRQRARAQREQRERDELRRRRLRRLIAVGVVASVIAVGLIVTFAILLRQSDLERTRLAQTQSAVLLARANGLFEQGIPGEPQSYLARALELDHEHRNAIARALAYLHQRSFPSLLATVTPQRASGERVLDVQWPAHDHLLIRHGDSELRWPVPAGVGVGSAKAAAAAIGEAVRELPSPLAKSSWDADGSARAMTSVGRLQVWLQGGRELQSATGRSSETAASATVVDPIGPLVVSADGQRVMLRAEANQVVVFALAPGRAPRRLHTINAEQGSSRFGPGGRRMVALAGTEVTLYDVDADQLHSLPHPLAVNALALSPDGGTLATACQDQQARMWDTRSGRLLSAPMSHGGAVLSVTFSADGERLLSGSLDGTARLWSVPSGRALVEPLLAGSAVSWARFSPEGSQAMLYDAEGRVTFWRLADPAPMRAQLQLPDKVAASAFDANSTRLAVATADGKLGLWSLPPAAGAAQVPRRLWQRDLEAARLLALAPGGDVLAVADAAHHVQLIDANTGKDLGAPLLHVGNVRSMRFNEQGTRLVTGADDGAARVFEVSSQHRVGFPVAPRPETVVHAEVSRDGHHLLTITLDKKSAGDQPIATVWLWAMGTRDVVRVATGEHAALASFTSDNEFLTVVGRTSQRWSIASGAGTPFGVAPKGSALTLGHLIWTAALSPDRKLLALGGLNGITRTVDLSAWRTVGDPMKSTAVVASLAFSSDGQWLLTRDLAGMARIWQGSSGIAVSDTIQVDGPSGVAYLDAKGAQTLTIDADGRMVLQRLGLDFPMPFPGWLPPLLTAAGGAALDDNGSIAWARDRNEQLQRLGKMETTNPWWQARRQEIMRRLGVDAVRSEGKP